MSILDELLKIECSDGVPHYTMAELFKFKNGYTPSKSVSEFWENGTIPWFRMEDIRNNGNILSDSIQHVSTQAVKGNLFPKNTIILATSATIGVHALITTEYLSNQRFTCLIPKTNLLNPYYLNYYADIIDTWCKEHIVTSSFPAVDMNALSKLLIPVPPLKVQEEIVRILDTFTELTAELTAELTLRKKQYEFYRDKLLSFDGLSEKERERLGITRIKIKNVFKRLHGTPITATKMKEIKDNTGEICIIAGGKTMIRAKESEIPHANITRVPAVLVQSRGVIDFQFLNEPFTFKNEMWAYTAPSIISVKYLYYYLKNNVQYFRNQASKMGSLPQISLPITEDYEINIPPIEMQEKIVNTLDNFEDIVHSFIDGIPAEIENRQKQYEYYRNKLLSFDKGISGAY